MLKFIKQIVYRIEGYGLASIGKNVQWGKSCSFAGKENIYIGNNVAIGRGCLLHSTKAKLIIKDNVMIGPYTQFHSANHDISVIGKNAIDVKLSELKQECYEDILVESDTWIGGNCTILKGVKVARGCVVGGGSVVRTSIPPYAVVIGNPAKVVGFRFTPEEIIKHEKKIYPENDRLPIDVLKKEL